MSTIGKAKLNQQLHWQVRYAVFSVNTTYKDQGQLILGPCRLLGITSFDNITSFPPNHDHMIELRQLLPDIA